MTFDREKSDFRDELVARRSKIHLKWENPTWALDKAAASVAPPKAVPMIFRHRVTSPLNPRLTFETFVVGESNEVAFSMARRVALRLDCYRYEPLLYVHAEVGLGKTHLLQAIAHATAEAGCAVVYLTAELFMHNFLRAEGSELSDRLRPIDVLLIDDVQFLQEISSKEFDLTLNALTEAGRQVVIAADRPPHALEGFAEGARSRLAGGVCVKISRPDEALRVKILQSRIATAKLRYPTLEILDEVIAYVASVIRTNCRDLDGAVNRLIAHTFMHVGPLDIEGAAAAIDDLVRNYTRKRIRVETIQSLVASHFNITVTDMLSMRRTSCVVVPRQVAFYLARTLSLRSLPEIGRRFNGRHHTTVMYGVRKITALIETDKELAGHLSLLKEMLVR